MSAGANASTAGEHALTATSRNDADTKSEHERTPGHRARGDAPAGLRPDVSPAVLAQTDNISQAASRSGTAVRDLRGLPWASIYNDDSRDLDQLAVAEPASDGAVKILVAIADVDVLVARDSAIDGHAWTNTTSVYTAAEIFPMLPVKLSTDLTSLGDGQERLRDRDRDGDCRGRHRDGFRRLPGRRRLGNSTAPGVSGSGYHGLTRPSRRGDGVVARRCGGVFPRCAGDACAPACPGRAVAAAGASPPGVAHRRASTVVVTSEALVELEGRGGWSGGSAGDRAQRRWPPTAAGRGRGDRGGAWARRGGRGCRARSGRR